MLIVQCMSNALTAERLLRFNERTPITAGAVLSSAPLSWRVTDSGGTWLELIVSYRPDGARVARTPVMVEELDSGWWIPGGCELSQTDADELLADVAKWACGAKGTHYFELQLGEVA